jgi:hypothetical protein
VQLCYLPLSAKLLKRIVRFPIVPLRIYSDTIVKDWPDLSLGVGAA